jgi:DNA polymerase-1
MILDDFLEEQLENFQEVETLIFDGNNLAARCNFANKDLTRSDGTKTGVVYGSIRSIKFLIEKFKPEKVIVVFDMGWSKRRLEIYPEYKQNRKNEFKTQEEINAKNEYINQIKRLQEYLEYLNISTIRIPKTEADDIIAFLLNLDIAKNAQDKTILISTDTDFYQFVHYGVKIYHPIQCTFIDEDYIKNKFEIDSKKYLLFKSMLGDKTDDISGVKGFGESAAKKVMKSYEINKIEDLKESALLQKGEKFKNFVKNFDIIKRNYKLIDLISCYLDKETQDEIINQLKKEKVFDESILNICKEDEINWGHNFFSFCKSLK